MSRQSKTKTQKKITLEALEESKQSNNDVPSDNLLKSSLKTGISEFS